MEAVLTKTLVVVVGGALVLPFVAAAVLVGARAVAGAGSTKQFFVLAALASAWTLLGGLQGFARNVADEREGHELLVAPRTGGARRQTFLNTRGL
jgi:hypothetical protein